MKRNIIAEITSLPSELNPRKNHTPFKLSEEIFKELTAKEIMQIDMRFWGEMILAQAKNLSFKVNEELLKPISLWFNDYDWIKKFDEHDEKLPDWAGYKKKARQWKKQQKHLARDRLRLYQKAIRQKKNFRQEVSKLLEKGHSKEKQPFKTTANFLTPIIKPFSCFEQTRIKLEKEFLQIKDISVSYLLPWRAILASEIKNKRKFSCLKVYLSEDRKTDKVCKLMALLHLENEGRIHMTQTEPFHDLKIQAESLSPFQLSFKDQDGKEWEQDWLQADSEEKDRLIDKIKSRQVVCREV